MLFSSSPSQISPSCNLRSNPPLATTNQSENKASHQRHFASFSKYRKANNGDLTNTVTSTHQLICCFEIQQSSKIITLRLFIDLKSAVIQKTITVQTVQYSCTPVRRNHCSLRSFFSKYILYSLLWCDLNQRQKMGTACHRLPTVRVVCCQPPPSAAETILI